MAVVVEVGSFTWPNTTAAQTITLANGALTPKAVIMWTIGPGASGFTAGAKFSIGFGTRQGGATQSGCVGIINVDNVATSDTARVRNTTLLHVLSNATTTDYTITLDSFGAGTIGVTASSGANANGDTIQYMAFGGTDITDAKVINWTFDAVAGAEAVTGSGFLPSAVFCLDSDLTNANSITAGMAMCVGAASSSSKFSCLLVSADDADTMTSGMTWGTIMYSNNCIARYTTGTTNIDALWDLDSFDSDGGSFGVNNAPTDTTRVVTLLFLKGGVWEAGFLPKDTDTGTDDFSLTNGSLTPTGLFSFSMHSTNASGGTQSNETDFSLGATDGTHNASAGITGTEAINTATDGYWSSSNCMVEIVGNTPTLSSNATSPVFSAGAFQVNWASNNGAADNIGFMVVGTEPVTTVLPNKPTIAQRAVERAAIW